MLRFEVEATAEWGEKIAVLGAHSSLGAWQTEGCLVLEASAYPLWTGNLALPGEALDYKYARVRPQEDGGVILLHWESMDGNRHLEPMVAAEVLICEKFGQASYRSLHTVLEAEKPPQNSEESDQSSALARADLPKRLDSGVLQTLDVQPLARFQRLVRSKSGVQFPAKYDLRRSAVLGTGMSGGVCLATARATGLEVAVKTLPLTGLTESQREQALAEVQNHLSMDHPNICRLLEVYEEADYIHLVLERLRGPDLYEHWSKRGRYSERDAASCVRQICSALAYCHGRGVCHRDLKLENFCLEDQDEENVRVKMIDFGLSTVTSAPMTDAVGTLYYVAPEVLRGKYDEKCDMWSLGVMTYILLTGRAPFAGRDDRDTVLRIFKGTVSLPSCLSADAKDFMTSLLKLQPEERPDAKTALQHTWVQDAEQDLPTAPLDGAVLTGLRAFTRANVVRRAFLHAVAPVSAAKEVSHWADQFAALDKAGTGRVAVRDLAEKLKEELGSSESEALSLASALADDGEELSYSSFLGACFAAQSEAAESAANLKDFFQKLDRDGDGSVSVEDLERALEEQHGDLEQLRAWLAESHSGGRMGFAEFRWVMLRPAEGLKELQSRAKHRVDTLMAKAGGDEALAARRRENASWRIWWRDGGPASASLPHPTASAAAQPELDMAGLPAADEGDWRVATAAAKDGDSNEARKENMIWRKWAMERGKEASEEPPPAAPPA